MVSGVTTKHERALPTANGIKATPQSLDALVSDILRQLTVTEKLSLLSGRDFWHTAAVPRLGVPR